MKYIFLVFVLGSVAFGSILSTTVLTTEEVNQVSATVLKQAEATKNYISIGTIGLAFIKSAKSRNYDGNSKLLFIKGRQLVNQAIKHYDPATTMIVGLNKSHKNYQAGLSIFARFVRESIKDKQLSITPLAHNIQLTFATLLLQYHKTYPKYINLAIHSLEVRQHLSNSDYFFLAQMFRRLGNISFANNYLNYLCMHVKSGKFYAYCHSNAIEYIQPLKRKLIHPWCHGDPTKQCH